MKVKNEQKKIVKISFEYLLEDGSKQIKFVENEDAEKWNEMMKTLCGLAENRRQNPDWSKLNWQEVIESK